MTLALIAVFYIGSLVIVSKYRLEALSPIYAMFILPVSATSLAYVHFYSQENTIAPMVIIAQAIATSYLWSTLGFSQVILPFYNSWKKSHLPRKRKYY